MTVEREGVGDVAGWDALFVVDVDERPVEFVKPADTTDPVWAVYQDGIYLGTVSACAEGRRIAWRVQATQESHQLLDDAVRALRRPVSWPGEREGVARWAAGLLADEAVLFVDVETTGLENAYAVQIAVVDRTGEVLFDEYLSPGVIIEPGAVSVHGITPQRVAKAATFGQLLSRLAGVLHGHSVVAYNAAFDHGVFDRELRRHFGDAGAARVWLERIRWHDAMVPYAVWRGLWSVKRGAYRHQPLGGPHDAVADCRTLIDRLQSMARSTAAARS